MERPKHYHYVDLLRGFAALAVLVCHYQWFLTPAVGAPFLYDGDLPFEGVLWPLYLYGGVAVQLFWALSGFVFAAAYGPTGKQTSAADFLRNRIARLYPLHLATLLFVAAVQAIGLQVNGEWQVYGNNDLPHFGLHLLFASDWFGHEGSFNAPIWSVSVEVLVYILFLAFLRAFGPRLLPALGIAAAALVLERVTGSLIAMCAVLFFVGVAMALVAAPLIERMGRLSLPVALAGIAAVAALLLAAQILGMGSKTTTILIYLGAPAVLFLFVVLDHRAQPLPARLHIVGAITYAVYLLHMPLLILVRTLIGGPLPEPSAWSLLAFVAAVIAMSVVVHRKFELPAQRLIRSWRPSRRRGRDRQSPSAAP